MINYHFSLEEWRVGRLWIKGKARERAIKILSVWGEKEKKRAYKLNSKIVNPDQQEPS
jgi:hypothetical protein